MKKIINCFLTMFMVLMVVLFMAPKASALQRISDEDLAITSKLSPQWLSSVIYASSANPQNQTVPFYYKVAAVIPGMGETLASTVYTGYAAVGPLSSTNSLRIMWADVNGATSYNLYKSADNSAFYLLINTANLTVVDYGQTLGAAYAAPTVRGGNLSVEKNITLGGVLYLGSATAIRGTIVPAAAGGKIVDATSKEVCLSTGTNAYTWVKELDGTTVCAH